ncbi:MAG: DUF192 domain-containing protein [Salinirussus sp.]
MHRAPLAIVLILGLIGAAIVGYAASGAFAPPSSPCANITLPDEVAASGPEGGTRIQITVPNGTVRASVDVRIAATPSARRVGLSETETLAFGEGMLFVHGSEARYTYWMKGMSFPLDIIFIDAEGEITTIHHAPTPDQLEGNGQFAGRGQYVLEVPRGYSNATGTEVGDCVAIPDNLRSAA